MLVRSRQSNWIFVSLGVKISKYLKPQASHSPNRGGEGTQIPSLLGSGRISHPNGSPDRGAPQQCFNLCGTSNSSLHKTSWDPSSLYSLRRIWENLIVFQKKHAWFDDTSQLLGIYKMGACNFAVEPRSTAVIDKISVHDTNGSQWN